MPAFLGHCDTHLHAWTRAHTRANVWGCAYGWVYLCAFLCLLFLPCIPKHEMSHTIMLCMSVTMFILCFCVYDMAYGSRLWSKDRLVRRRRVASAKVYNIVHPLLLTCDRFKDVSNLPAFMGKMCNGSIIKPKKIYHRH